MEAIAVLRIVSFSVIAPTIAVFVVALNGIFIIVLLKNRSLQTSSNAVLGCLCSSDLLVGIFTIIVLALHNLIMYGQGSYERITLYNAFITMYLGFTGLSSLCMILVNLDRYFAICHPYKYIKYATPKLYTIVFICTCLVYALANTVSFAMDKIYRAIWEEVIFAIIFTATMTVLIYCNWKILRVIARHRREIASVERHSHGQNSGFQGETKRYRIIVILVILFAICKLPQILFYLLVFIGNLRVTLPLIIFSYVFSCLLLVNSLVNPLIFCFSVKCFCTAVKTLFCCQRAVQ